MNCKSAREMLSAYLDRELASAERDAVRAHLADCDACRTEEADLRSLKGLLLGVRAPEPTPDFERRLMGRIRQEAARPVRPPLFPRLSPLAWTQIGGLAAAGALACVVVFRPQPAETVVESPRPHRGTVANNVDVAELARGYEAFSRADDFAGGTSLLIDAP